MHCTEGLLVTNFSSLWHWNGTPINHDSEQCGFFYNSFYYFIFIWIIFYLSLMQHNFPLNLYQDEATIQILDPVLHKSSSLRSNEIRPFRSHWEEPGQSRSLHSNRGQWFPEKNCDKGLLLCFNLLAIFANNYRKRMKNGSKFANLFQTRSDSNLLYRKQVSLDMCDRWDRKKLIH